MTDLLIPAEEARRRLENEAAVLVCAYDDEQQCEELALEQSISWLEFEACREALPVERDVILFATADDEDAAVDRAQGLRDEGRENTFAIEGGFDAARDAGLVLDE